MPSHDPQRPNVLFIVSDDQGPWALGCAGNDDIHTPVLDQLAASGTRLDNFFCASPVCSPARASLLTGQVPSTHGVHDYLRMHVGPDAVDFLQGQVCVTDVFADHGYRLGLSGKWHLGANDQPRRGFTHWYAHEAGSSPYYGAPMYRNGEREMTSEYLTDALAADAEDFVRAETADADQPFLLCLNFTAPHSPWAGQHPVEFTDLYTDCSFESCPQVALHPWTTMAAGRPLGGEPDTHAALVGYFAAVTGMDAAIGRVLAAVDDLGLTDSTMVVFCSDNGFNAGHHGIWGKGNGTWPMNMYDSSVKVPAIISQPGRVTSGSVRSELLSAYDLAATLLDLAGLDPEPMQQGPGRSFASLLRPLEPGQSPNPLHQGAVVVFDEYGPVRMIRTQEWKYVHRWPEGPHELYDLMRDPGERVNRAQDPRARDVVMSMALQLQQWFETYGTPERDGQKLAVIGTGQLATVDQAGAFTGPLWDSTAGQGNSG